MIKKIDPPDGAESWFEHARNVLSECIYMDEYEGELGSSLEDALTRWLNFGKHRFTTICGEWLQADPFEHGDDGLTDLIDMLIECDSGEPCEYFAESLVAAVRLRKYIQLTTDVSKNVTKAA